MNPEEGTFLAAHGHLVMGAAALIKTSIKRRISGMSMDLKRKIYETEPSYFIAGTRIRITTEVKEAAAPLKAHTPVILADDKAKPVENNGSVVTTGIYGITAESAESGEEVVIYLTGEFFAEGLNLESGVKAKDVEVPLRNIGIFLK